MGTLWLPRGGCLFVCVIATSIFFRVYTGFSFETQFEPSAEFQVHCRDGSLRILGVEPRAAVKGKHHVKHRNIRPGRSVCRLQGTQASGGCAVTE